ncbi:rod shape-determining protein RodA [Bordetella holmesii]|uniref:Peptidoglycan glycosyltransferase MrdB n=2 Tax=Bordetella holmesii TaxID=35814 RepID=A0A158M6T3_9BORD|nr:rod shape-determining protein RodA [Bordetella holmesii]AHV91815.1 rod shape-determining protein RodA [Bordetella holmesii ATCC 51541]AIT26467.1 rod shape-determining protein RodA [Bordetella holmesii 44057]EWM43011.1 rod shape-determining protein RodA [Bordetella holmesii 41130]EWM47041.1 rod shape-determining protein RodA [Bordetella holmesii 35009]EWM51209.1 rod shape-determining protein RodA [Bordetella holmesii 70147]
MKRLGLILLRVFTAFDWPLLLVLVLFAALGLTIMHSAVGSTDWRFAEQSRNFIIAFFAMWIMALVPPQTLMKLALPFYVVGIVLLLGVEFAGETSKGATRWLNLGFTRIQPSEMMKIAVPMMLAWYFQRHEGQVRIRDFLVAALMLVAPFGLIVLQPDLGTALLVFGAGFFVIYFAGLSFKLLVPAVLAGVVAIGTLVYYEDQLCEPDVDWVVLHDYQKHRVCTLLNPSSDPLGKGFHTIQSMIAVGSGGLYGKGYMKGTQTHLDFIPERTTDFIFAVYAEEFGLYGGVALLVLYGLLIARGLAIASRCSNQFGRLLAGSMTMMMFIYVFVNVGMVTGILPVVGVPLPFMSYGGTALLTMGVAFGIMMSISRSKPVKA